jgi:hypothetical protein
VLEHPDKPLLPFEVGGDRRRADATSREGRRIEEELSPRKLSRPVRHLAVISSV